MITFMKHVKKFLNAKEIPQCGVLHYRGDGRVYAVNGSSMIWAQHGSNKVGMVDPKTGEIVEYAELTPEKFVPEITANSTCARLNDKSISRLLTVARTVKALNGSRAYLALVWDRYHGLHVAVYDGSIEKLYYYVTTEPLDMVEKRVYGMYDAQLLSNVIAYIKDRDEDAALYAPARENKPLLITTAYGGAVLMPVRNVTNAAAYADLAS